MAKTEIPFVPVELLLKSQPNQVIYFPNKEMAVQFIETIEDMMSDETDQLSFKEDIDYVITPLDRFFLRVKDAVDWALV